MAEKETKTVEVKKKKKSFPLYFVAIGAFALIFAGFLGITMAFKQSSDSFVPASSLSKEELELFVKDLNPMQIQQLSQNKAQLTDELRNLLSVARAAHKEGVTEKPEVKRELEFIRKAITATNYDQSIEAAPKEGEPPAPRQPFGDITEEEIADFWSGKGEEGVTKASREKEFKDFIAGKIALQKATKQVPEDQKPPSDEELKPIKENYARTLLTYEKAKEKFAGVNGLKGDEKTKWADVKRKTELQIKLQQSQFLTSFYVQTVLNEKVEPTEAEIKKYLADNPDIGDEKKKKEKVGEIIGKLNAGGDFSELAKQFSEDPGSKENGGLYEDVPMGRMNPIFEKAALALEAGSYTKEPVKTDFGYHIIKLESVSDKPDAEGNPAKTYNVRHILISTQISDPNSPFSQPMSPEEFAKSKLAEEKEKKVLDEILARNPVSVPKDFDLPKPPANTPNFPMQPGQMPQPQQMPPQGQPAPGPQPQQN